MAQTVICTASDMQRTLSRITHEITERNQETEQVMLVGIHTRGIPLARRLSAAMTELTGIAIPVCTLDIRHYRDDIRGRIRQPGTGHCKQIAVNEKTIVLVDDVLYTGRTTRAAMDALTDLGRPQSIQLAVLIDRGHRELPIRPDYVGRNIPSSRQETILVHLLETDGIDEVVLQTAEVETGTDK